MSIPAIGDFTMYTLPSYIGNLSRSNQYQVFITDSWGRTGVTTNTGSTTGISSSPFLNHLSNTSLFYDVDFSTDQTLINLSCAEATLPTSSYATSEVKDNYIGITQEFAHTRINTDIDFTFYVDRNYKVLAFFEAWMDYISGGGEISLYNTTYLADGYYRRFNYPKYYKNESGVYIKKFEKDWKTEGSNSVTYQLINSFPKSIASIPIAYGSDEILKVTVTMNYDRYILRRETTPFSDVVLGDETLGLNDLPGSITSTLPIA